MQNETQLPSRRKSVASARVTCLFTTFNALEKLERKKQRLPFGYSISLLKQLNYAFLAAALPAGAFAAAFPAGAFAGAPEFGLLIPIDEYHGFL